MKKEHLESLLFSLPLIGISVGVGYGISRVVALNWFSASLFVSCALLMIGTWLFSDDADVMISECGDDAEKAGELRRDARRNETINSALILILLLVGVAYIYM
jgi:hypothetical protein